MPRIIMGLLPHVKSLTIKYAKLSTIKPVKSLIIEYVKRLTIKIVLVKIVTVLLFQQSLHLLIKQHQPPNADFKILFLLCYKIV